MEIFNVSDKRQVQAGKLHDETTTTMSTRLSKRGGNNIVSFESDCNQFWKLHQTHPHTMKMTTTSCGRVDGTPTGTNVLFWLELDEQLDFVDFAFNLCSYCVHAKESMAHKLQFALELCAKNIMWPSCSTDIPTFANNQLETSEYFDM